MNSKHKNKNCSQESTSIQNSFLNKAIILEVTDICNDYNRWVPDVEQLSDIFKEGLLIKEERMLHVCLNFPSSFMWALKQIPTENVRDFDNLPTILQNYGSFIIFQNKTSKAVVTKTECPKLFEIFYEMKVFSKSGNISLNDFNQSRKASRTIHKINTTVSLRRKKESKRKAMPPKPERYVFPINPQSGDISELPRFPIQVSENQRESQSEQVVSDHEMLIRPDISYLVSQSPHQPHEEDTPRYFSTLQSSPSSQRPGPPPRYPDYVSESQRLDSYIHWTVISPNPHQLAKAGFFSTNQEDLVRCFQCGIGLRDFSAEDDPLLEHVRHSGDCPYLLLYLGEERLADMKRQLQTTDPDYNRQLQWNNRHNAGVTTRYRHPEYQTFEARLATFRRWPSNIGQTPSQLAEAGLYYTGFEDHVRCFACDGGLRRWDPEDDPWTEHCRWFPACPYCIEQKGEEYIALVQASIEQDHLGASGGGGAMINTAAQLKIKEKEVQAFYNTTKGLFDDMGFQEADVKEAVLELCNRGTPTPEIEDVVDLIGVIHERKEAEREMRASQSESLLEQNTRLRKIVYCSNCKEKTVSALFLPCTHLELCMECAEPLIVCPVCKRVIREKIRTFMG